MTNTTNSPADASWRHSCAEGSEPTSLDDGRSPMAERSRHTDTCALPAPLFDAWAHVYRFGDDVAHLALDTDHHAVCGIERPDMFDGYWYGTGSQNEYEHAESLPLCAECAKAATP